MTELRLDHKSMLKNAMTAFREGYSNEADIDLSTIGSGIIELAPLFYDSSSYDVTNHIWFLHDVLYGKPWFEQVAIIGQTVGPSHHFVPLASWAWMAYDGWVMYLSKHRHAPVDLVGYINAHINADDLRNVHLQEF